MSGWQGYLTCKECDAEHDFKTHAYSDGVCPYCGHTGWSSTFTEVHQGIKRWTRTALGGDSGEGKGSGISWWAQSGGEFISLGHFRIGTTVTEMPYAIEVMEV